MSKLFCEQCKCLVEEPHHWKEPYSEKKSGCQCGNALIEIEPCKICGEYPVNEYEEGKLKYGICVECFEDGLQTCFMEYLNTLDDDDQAQFYFGTCSGGHAYDSTDILLMARTDYLMRVKLHQHIFGAEREAAIWRQFIRDGDIGCFCDWLIARSKRGKLWLDLIKA